MTANEDRRSADAEAGIHQARLLTLAEVQARNGERAARSVTPGEHHLSLMLPTRRKVLPTYARFASPARRRRGEPLVLGTPDRWWLLSATTGQLVLYAYCNVLPFLSEHASGDVTLAQSQLSVAQMKARQQALKELLDRSSPAFFLEEPVSVSDKLPLVTLLLEHLDPQVLPWYRALAPDFFAWLGV